jgi:hypothetical protein
MQEIRVLKHARNFGTPSDEIGELSGVLQSASLLDVDLHINWDERDPQLWELEFIKNSGAIAGNGSLVLNMVNDAADLHRKSIVGFAQNMADCRSPPHAKLLSWYERHGFAQICVEEHGVQVKRRWQR